MPTVETYGFNKAVQRFMSPIKVSKALITQVRNGQRNNEAVKEAIKEVCKTWNYKIPVV